MNHTTSFIRHLVFVAWNAAALVLLLQTAGCGEGNAAEGPTDPIVAQRTALRTFLYERSGAKVEYWPQWSEVPSELQYLQQRFGTLPVSSPGVQIGLFRITYATNTLPQFTLHLKRPGNLRLLAYNHGHGGLPAAFEASAIEFLQAALGSGYDLLISSMPLTGLNAVHSGETYTIATRGHNERSTVAAELLETPLYQHPLYEVIADADHYMHYFVDGTVMAASASASHLARAESVPYGPAQPVLTMPAYIEISYVGLSGGATVGLTACAIHRFERCILIAGVMPDYLRVTAEKNWGDAEQITRSYSEKFNVQQLMTLARAGSGKLIFVYNRYDPCCFADPAASALQRDFPGYDIRITELQAHAYTASSLLSMLKE